MKAFLALALTALVGFTAQAEEHGPATMKGTHIELFERGHSFAGQILDTPVFGVFDEANFNGRMEFRTDFGTQVLTLASVQPKGYEGSVTETKIDTAGAQVNVATVVKFVKSKHIGGAEGEQTINIDGKDIVVSIKGESFGNGHFQKPEYTAVINGETVSLKFTGEACYGYSANIAMMIFGTYAHLSK